MRKKTIAITITLFLAISVVGTLFLAFVKPAAATYERMPFQHKNPMDPTPEMLGDKEIAMRKKAAELGSAEATGASMLGDPATIGEEITLTVGDFVEGNYEETFVVLMDGTHGIICLEKAAYDAYDSVNDWYVVPNPYNIWRDEDYVSTAQLAYLLEQFDTIIYPTDTSIYGEPLARGAEGQKCWILIHNIRDESYYPTPPGEEPVDWYVAGYFSSEEDATNNKNMFHMDTYDWEHRVGTAENDWFLDDEYARPNLYEGTFAHEFEHLIHFDIDPDEPSWVDEGLADMAGWFCGYGHPDGHIQRYLDEHFMVPLTFWGSTLADYGASYLFQLYLYDHFGGVDFIKDLVLEQANGIEGIEKTLKAHRYWWVDFDEIFDRWTIANYIDEKHRWCGKYGYESIEIGSADTRGWTIEFALTDWNAYIQWVFETYYNDPNVWTFPFYEVPFEITEYDWQFALFGYPMPYTAHYFRFNNDRISKMEFEGAPTSDIVPTSGSSEWYSGVGAWAWRNFYQTFDIPASGATLNFMTNFDIEGDWDYGYVEVYDQDTLEWYTLYADGTVDDLPNAQMNENCPDEREPMTYLDAGRWHAFTGYSGGWMPVTMDLTPFAGHTIDLYFTTWQDGAFTLMMMYVDDIAITGPEIDFFDDVEAGEAGWTNNGWEITDGIYPNGWSMNLITVKGVTADRYPDTSDWKLKMRRQMWIRSGTQTGCMWITPVKTGRDKFNVAIVSNHADHIIAATYHFSVELKSFWKWWKW
ncbi:MAG: hypothetical protein ACFFC1_21525 [Promethearchaeota archaeon]